MDSTDSTPAAATTISLEGIVQCHKQMLIQLSGEVAALTQALAQHILLPESPPPMASSQVLMSLCIQVDDCLRARRASRKQSFRELPVSREDQPESQEAQSVREDEGEQPMQLGHSWLSLAEQQQGSQAEHKGYIIARGDLKPDPEKVWVIVHWPRPPNRLQLQRFLGFANFYRRFIIDFKQWTSRENKQELEAALRCIVSHNQTTWYEHSHGPVPSRLAQSGYKCFYLYCPFSLPSRALRTTGAEFTVDSRTCKQSPVISAHSSSVLKAATGGASLLDYCVTLMLSACLRTFHPCLVESWVSQCGPSWTKNPWEEEYVCWCFL
ncbi:uncharacterized protein LOC113016385 isoform X3 [Astatotilapia calliptera]|uniref:uncharacterized protein LOC113016385 isoform X3 n=1 Tax=Astatotilapia calliptera TaxID=8154 RepID=UPI000E403C0E|nr:uncharacterized protein LOC113016385 isoform X3 [Astatotilapia calliptera]